MGRRRVPRASPSTPTSFAGSPTGWTSAAYTVYALGVDLGRSGGYRLGAVDRDRGRRRSRACVVLARRGDERRAFVLALTAAIAFSPIVWLHYFALLLVVVAIAQPRLAPIWFIGIPLQLVVDTGVYNGSTFQTAAVLVAAAVTVALALAPARGGSDAPGGYAPLAGAPTVISSSR